MDNRAQSIGIARYILGLIVGAVMVWIVTLITDPILSGSENATSNAAANQATTWLSQWVDWFPMLFLLISFVGIIVYSIFVRETAGR